MKNKDEVEKNKLDLPDIISNDLTYYMQFGWKRLREASSRAKSASKFLGNTYQDNFPPQQD